MQETAEERARRESTYVCEPFDILPLLRSVTGFASASSIDDLSEEERLRWNLYQIGGSLDRMKVNPLTMRKIWAAACAESTRQEFWTPGGRLPCIRLGRGAMTAALKPVGWNDMSSLKARWSLDLDALDPRNDRPFPSPDAIHKAVCGFLQEFTESVIEGTEIDFAKEPATLLLGSNNRKWVSAHIVFHSLAQPQSMEHFERATKKGLIHKKFNQVMAPLGLDADTCLTGLRWEFTDKQDSFDQDEGMDVLVDDVRRQKKVWRWRRAVLPIAARFNCEGDLVSWSELADELDPHVMVHDPAWDREVRWIRVQAPAPPPPRRTDLVSSPEVMDAVQPWNVEAVCAKIWATYPALYPAPYPRVKQKTFGDGKLMVQPVSLVCPLKTLPSSDQPAFSHSSEGKFYVVAHPSGLLTAHCHVCGEKTTLVEVRETLREDVLSEFDEVFVRVAQYVYMRPTVDTFKLEYDRRYPPLSKDSFLNHARTLALERGKPLIKKGEKYMRRALYWFYNSRYMYDATAFVPEQNIGDRVFNSWTGFSYRIRHIAEAFEALSNEELMQKWAHTRHHILQNACAGNEVTYNALIGFFADIILVPWRKPKWAIVFWGPPGGGKGLIVLFFGEILGRLNFIHADNRTVAGDYNASILDKLLIYADEGIDQQNSSALGYVKKLLSEEEQTSRQKYVAEYQVDTCFRIVAATNDDPDWVTPGDRRWMVCGVPMSATLQNAEINAERQSGEGPAAFYVLAKRGALGLPAFNPYECVSTLRKWELQMSKFTPVQRYWHNVLCLEPACRSFVGNDITVDKYGRWMSLGLSQHLHDIGHNVFAEPDQVLPKALFYCGFRESCSVAVAAKVKDAEFWLQTATVFGCAFEKKQVRVGAGNTRVQCIVLPALGVLRERFRVQQRGPADMWDEAADAEDVPLSQSQRTGH